jgi:hypothetical protein
MTLTRNTSTRRKQVKKAETGRSFAVLGEEGKAVKKILLDTHRYITVHELRTPAKVVDKLRRDFDDLGEYNRNSMKLGVRKILNSQEVVSAINGQWGGEMEPRESTTTDGEETHVVSTSTRAER